MGGGYVGQAAQIMFKVLLLLFCGELWHSEEGGGSVGRTGTLRHTAVADVRGSH